MTDPTPQTVVVIGGGIIGIACAHYLANDGFDVTIVDSGTMGAGCSFGNCGYICPSHALPLTTPAAVREGVASMFDAKAAFRVKPRMEISFVNWMWQFAKRCTHKTMIANGHHLDVILRSSMREYLDVLDGVISRGEWKKTGLFYAFQTSTGLTDFLETVRILQDCYGIRSKLLCSDEVSAFDASLTEGLAGGVHFSDDASVRPDALTNSWIGHLERNGVRLVENAKVKRIVRKGSRIESISTDKMTLSGDHFVLAAGAMSGQLAQLFNTYLPIEPGKGYSITFERPINSPKIPMLFPEDHVGISPFEGGFRVGSMMEFVGFDSRIPEFRLKQLGVAASRYLALSLPEHNLEEWFGWRPMTWDSLPIVGAMDGIDNLCCATGHNMLGMSLAPATGRLVAELIQGKDPHIDPLPYSPNRFR